MWTEQQERCSKCGNPRKMCADPELDWFPQRAVCFADMQKAGVQAAYDDLHGDKSGHVYHDGTFARWAAKWSLVTPFRFSDGVTIYVSTVDVDPGDEFISRHDAQPSALRAQQAVEQDD